MRTRAVFVLLFLVVLLTRLCHINILWTEEDLPLAAALQMLHGKMIYSEVWFDKPPLVPAVYLLWGAQIGWILRLAGTVYVLLVAWLGYITGKKLWSEREGLLAACLLAFYLVFGIPGAVLPLAADLLMVAPHLAAVYFAIRKNALLSGLMCGIALLLNSKALFVLAVCGILQFRQLFPLLAGFVLPNLAVLLWFGARGALGEYYLQVWQLGMLYSQHTFVDNPIGNGIQRTLNWLGFHTAVVAGALVFWCKDRSADRWRFAVWALFSLAAITLGWRFFPRYYLQLLPVFALAGARGITLLGKRGPLILLLLLIPAVRFAPRYATLAADLASGREHRWNDILMDQDSRAASSYVSQHARPSDTLFVWGYRPDVYAYTRLPAASRFLESQPLTGVLADRHLTQASRLPAAWLGTNRKELTQSRPEWILDGLGTYNPALAITAFPDLGNWLADYKEVQRTTNMVIYARQPNR